jgi:hypothetical protein
MNRQLPMKKSASRIAKVRFERHRLHDMVCAAFQGPKPTENSIAIIIEKGLHPTARIVQWLTQNPNHAYQ